MEEDLDVTSHGGGKSLADVIGESLESSGAEDPDSDRFSGRAFFHKWFRKYGEAYYFAFRKNLRVTNMQYAELLALLRIHTHRKFDSDRAEALQFLTVPEFKILIEETVRAFEEQGTTSGTDERSKLIDNLYGQMLESLVVVDALFGSCIVMMPPALTLDIDRVCGESGYIHSCGRLVFARNTTKASGAELIKTVAQHIDRFYPDRNDVSDDNVALKTAPKHLFVVFADEDFTPHDRGEIDVLKDGLDELKLPAEKFYLGREPLVAVVDQLSQDLADSVLIAPPGDYKNHYKLRGRGIVDKTHTFWLVADRGAGVGGSPGTDRYLICYDQTHFNDSPFHIFDENKPAWVNHTTMPHTLVGAAINVTRPLWHRETYPGKRYRVKLSDPFVGSGTTLLEAAKFYPEVQLQCGDLDPVSPLLARDNLMFFAMTQDELQDISNRLQNVSKSLKDRIDISPVSLGGRYARLDINDPSAAAYDAVMDFLEKADFDHSAEFSLTKDQVRELEAWEFKDRLLLYVALRGIKRHAGAFGRGSERFITAFLSEADVLVQQVSKLLERRSDIKYPEKLGENGAIIRFTGLGRNYSAACTLNQEWFGELARKGELERCVKVEDAKDLDVDSLDLIIADPPYGINTENLAEALAGLYAESLRAMLRALRDGGQLILCLADRVHTGRASLFFTHKEFIVRQIDTIARTIGREAVVPKASLSHPGDLFQPPYYWEAKRALRRAILHYRVWHLDREPI